MEVTFVSGPNSGIAPEHYVFHGEILVGSLRKLKMTPTSKYEWQFLKYKVPGDPRQGGDASFFRKDGFGTDLATAKVKVIEHLCDPVEALVETKFYGTRNPNRKEGSS
jgi:hypothetical protein